MTDCCHDCKGDCFHRSAQDAINLQHKEMRMAAPNAQPAGSRPGPKKAHTHAPHKAGMPASGADNSTKLTPGHTKGIKTNPVAGANKNKLH